MVAFKKLVTVVTLRTIISILVLCQAVDGAVTPAPLKGQMPMGDRMKRARTILEQATLVPGPRSVQWFLEGFHSRGRRLNSSELLKIPSKAIPNILPGLKQLKDSNVAAQVWSVKVPCDAQYHNAVQILLEQLDGIKRLITLQSKYTRLVTSSPEVHEARRGGVLGSLLRIEGGHSLGSSLGVLRSLPELGVSSLSLTHTCTTPWAESASSAREAANARGLTKFGRDLLGEMNRIGLVIDLSGSSINTAIDSLRLSRSPILFSDSFTLSKCPTGAPTAIPDHILKALPDNNGVILIPISNADNSSQNACGHNNSVRAAIEHINHVRELIGVNHVGVGSTNNPKWYAVLVAELLKDSSWSFQELQKLLGANFLRVLEENLQTRDILADDSPSEEIIPIHDIDDKWPCRFKFGSLPNR